MMVALSFLRFCAINPSQKFISRRKVVVLQFELILD